MKRSADILLGTLLLIIMLIPMLIIAIWIKLTSAGPVLYWSNRVGKNNQIFSMPKYRTMTLDAPLVATHLLTDTNQYLTHQGKFLRKYSLDELPQLFCILKGEMSFVGPRPALYNQKDLIALRTEHDIHTLVPGLTGYAQIHGRDSITIQEKVKRDEEYFQNRSFSMDINILLKTFIKVLRSEDIKA